MRQCTNTGGISPHTSLLVTHLPCLSQFSETGRCNIPAYAIALRLMATVSCPSIKRILLYRLSYIYSCAIYFILSILHICFSETVGTRFSGLKALTNITNGVFYVSSHGGRPFFVKQLFIFIIALFSLNYLENIQLTPTDGIPVYYSVRDRGIGYIGTHSTIFLF